MNKTLLGIGLLIISVSAFFMWINPHYGTVKILKAELADSKSALAQAQELDSIRDKLVEKENSFSLSDVAKLKKFLPDSVDNIRFIIDMQGIASHYGLAIGDISVGDTAKTTSSGAAIGPSSKQYGETQLGFSVATSYENLISFLKDIEKSLRVMEIKSLSFNVDNKSPNVYKVSITVGAFWAQKASSIKSL